MLVLQPHLNKIYSLVPSALSKDHEREPSPDSCEECELAAARPGGMEVVGVEDRKLVGKSGLFQFFSLARSDYVYNLSCTCQTVFNLTSKKVISRKYQRQASQSMRIR